MRAELMTAMHQRRPLDPRGQFILETSGIQKFTLVFKNRQQRPYPPHVGLCMVESSLRRITTELNQRWS